MLVDTPANPTPTPSLLDRAPSTGQMAGPGAPQYAPAPKAPDQFDGVLDQVHRDWSAALDDAGPDQAPSAPQGTPFGDDLRTGASVDQWKPAAEQISRAAGVPPDVTLALVHATSGGDPTAKLAGGQAVGLAAVPVHRFGPGQDPTDPATNLGVALGQLKTAYQRTGDWTKAAMAATGYGDKNGEPRVVGNGVDGFSWRAQFEAARRRYGGV